VLPTVQGKRESHMSETIEAPAVDEFLARVFSFADADGALRYGLSRIVQTLDAAAAAIVSEGEVAVAVGFARGVPARELRVETPEGGKTTDLPGIGLCRVVTAPLDEDGSGHVALVLGGNHELGPADLCQLRALTRVLGVASRSLRSLAAERALRTHSEQQAEENSALLEALGERQALLERLAKVQRLIVDRVVLQDVLDAIVSGASDLLNDEIVALRLVDTDDPEWMVTVASQGLPRRAVEGTERERVASSVGGRAIRERRTVISHDYPFDPDALPHLRKAGLQAAMSTPVLENGIVVGSLTVGTYRSGRMYKRSEQEILKAFAEHASMALADHRNFDAAVHRAFHDMLTDLPNRALFLDRLEQAMLRGERSGALTAVLFLDLDGFKRVNDSLGHAAGDQLLIEVAGRLEDCLRPSDTAARFGGDEFAILLEDLERGADATMVASRILASLQEPIVLQDRRVAVSASIGVALQREPGEDLLRNADLAMYRAKSLGKSRYEVFDPALHTVVMERLRLESELQKAVENDEFKLEFQPIVEVQTGAISAVETLIRWQHPDDGLLYPTDFIGVAEETRLISAIGRWVLNEACRQAVRWQQRFPSETPLAISVNLSVTQLQQPGLIYEVAEALERSGLSPESLILEITETLLMDNVDLMVETFDGLKRLGVHLAVDDFGTGYSSLQYLRRFPIDILKIAKPFVDGIAAPGGSTLARVIVDLGKSLGLRVIAEGIENDDQVGVLEQMGCRWGQGFQFAYPLREEAIDALLAGKNAIAGWPPRDALADAATPILDVAVLHGDGDAVAEAAELPPLRLIAGE
jgi:diguanylate cyclase (GGDEF)-like protein